MAIAGDRQRAAHLAEVCELLWPAPASATPSVGSPPGRASAGHTGDPAVAPAAGGQFIVVPSLQRPRLLVPTGRRPAAAALRRYGQPGSLRAYFGTRALSLAFTTGAGTVLFPGRIRIRAPAGASTIDSYLRAELGLDVRLSMYLSAPRANRKPVLQLLTPGGAAIGFAKIGVSPLTRELVRAELAALVRLRQAGLAEVTIPDVLHFGTWEGLDVLVLAALPAWRRHRRVPQGQFLAAMTEVARVAGCASEPLARSAYWARLAARVTAAGQSADRLALTEALAELGRRAGTAVLPFGAWHGDWTPWNMASTRRGLLVWDWERFTTGVPVGFDALHHWLQSEVVSGRRDPAVAAADCVERAPALLGPLAGTASAARLTALLYLSELSARYLGDRQAEAGARLGAPGRWLIPAVVAGAGRL